MSAPSGTPSLPQLFLRHEDLEALRDDFEQNLRFGRAFVAGEPALAERQACELVVTHPESGNTASFECEVVWVQRGEVGQGVGVELHPFGQDEITRLEELLEASKQAPADNPHQRVRSYNGAEQLRAAREGELAERVALERVYGKSVWEALLQNPRLTVPEVSRIARKGNIPKPLIETIVGNAAWLSSSELRRALLSNPRLGGTALDKVLRALPKQELAIVANQASFPMAVRQTAKKLRSG